MNDVAHFIGGTIETMEPAGVRRVHSHVRCHRIYANSREQPKGHCLTLATSSNILALTKPSRQKGISR